MYYRNVIREDKITDYIKLHKKFYRELSFVNTDILFMEKVYDFPFGKLGLSYEALYYQYILENTFQYLIVKLHRITNDNSEGVLTFRNFKNKVISEFLKDEFKEKVIHESKEIKLEETMTNKIREFRHDYFAHKNIKFFNDIFAEQDIYFSEVQKYVFALNDLFKVFSFEVEDQYDKSEYFDVNIRETIKNSFSEIIDNCLSSHIVNSDFFNPSNRLFRNDELDEFEENEKNMISCFRNKVKSLDI